MFAQDHSGHKRQRGRLAPAEGPDRMGNVTAIEVASYPRFCALDQRGCADTPRKPFPENPLRGVLEAKVAELGRP